MKNNKNNVYNSYEKIANWFDEHRSRDLFEKPWLDKAISLTPKGVKILDLGCGMGQPIAEYFISKGFDVTGVDGSWNLIEMAKKKLPNAKFFRDDMRGFKHEQEFDLVIAWNSLFHLSQEDQRSMFKTFAANQTRGYSIIYHRF